MVKYPEDWKVVLLGEVATMFSGGTPASSIEAYYGGGIPWVSISDMTRAGKYICETEKTLSNEGYSSCSARMYPRNTLLFAMYASIGKCCIAEESVCSSQAILGLYNLKDADLEYLYQCLVSREKEFASLGQTGTQSNLSKAIVQQIKIPLPPLPEQKRIAAVLGNVDKLIDNLSRRIEKKRLVKQGVMQDLLSVGPAALTQRAQSSQRNAKTLRSSVDSAFFASAPAGNLVPRRRLPGFKGEWKRVKLGEVATMFSGGTPTAGENQFYGGSIPWTSISDMTAAGKFLGDTEKKLTQLGFDSCSAKMYPANTLLFAMYASIGKCCIANKPVCSSQAILGIYNLEDIDLEFLYQVLHSRETEFASMGQTGTQSNLSKQIVEKIEVDVPTLPEQKAIAGVLGAMDEEIAKLEAKLEKYRSLKQGLMNDLLTGRVRLVVGC